MIPTNHLTEEQMYDLLDPTADTNLHPHLRACTHCQSELTNLRESLDLFRDAATSFAASAAPRRLPVVEPVASRFFSPKIWATSFATATALLVISLSVLHPAASGPGKAPIAAVAAPQTTASADSDEALLEGIQQDLSTSIPPSLEPLAAQTASSENATQN